MEKRIRVLRIGSLIQRELGPLIHDKLRDPSAQTVVITDVEVSKDLSVAAVYVHSGEAFSNEEVCRHLNRAAGYLLKHLATRLSLRALPRLVFRVDNSLEQGARMEALLSNNPSLNESDEASATPRRARERAD